MGIFLKCLEMKKVALNVNMTLHIIRRFLSFLCISCLILRLFFLLRSLPMITAFGPWMKRIKTSLLVSIFNRSNWCFSFVCFVFYFFFLHLIVSKISSDQFSVCVCVCCVQVRRWSSSALGKVFSIMPSRATMPVFLPMDKLVITFRLHILSENANTFYNRAYYNVL